MIGLGSLAESMQAKSKRRFNLLMLEEREYYFHVRPHGRCCSRRLCAARCVSPNPRSRVIHSSMCV